MKLQNLFLTLFAAAVMMVGCGPKEDPQPALPVLNVGQTELTFEQGGGTATLTVTSNRPWTITSDADWIAFNPSSGSAADAPVNVTVTALANSSTDRTSSFRVKTDFDYKTVSVSQKGAKGEDTTDKPSGDGTKDNPYNPAGVVAYLSTLAADTESPNVVYVTGKISEVKATYESSGSYGNANFYISEDGSKTLTQFYVFQTYYLGNKKWKSGQTDVKVGDVVTICGKVVNYKGNTPETVGKGSSYVCTLNGTTEYGEGGGDQPEAKGKGTLEDPFNPSAAANAVADLTWTDKDNYQTTDNVYVKGKISRIADNGTFTEGGTYGNASFYIVEDGTDFEFYVYRTLYLGNKKYESGQTDIKVGDEVVIYGKLMNYRGNTPETVAGSCYLYSLNGQSAEGDQPGGETEEVKDATVAEFLAAAESETQPYKLVGKVSDIQSDVYGNFNLTDATGTVYVYGLVSKDLGGFAKNKANDKSFASIGVKEGDEITIIGFRQTFTPKEGDPVIEVVGAYYVSGASGSGDQPGGDTEEVKNATVSQFIAAEKSTTQPYKLTGTVSNIKSDVYGNFDLTDETGTVYIYGLVSKDLGGYAKNKANDKSFKSIGIKEGDKITIVTFRDDYTNASGETTIEGVGGYYISGASGEGGSDSTDGIVITDNGESVDFSKLGFENSVQYKTISGTKNISITFGDGANDGKYYNTGTGIRIYGNGYVNIESSSKTIAKIVYTFATGNDYKPANDDVSTPSGYNASATTWTGSAKSVKLTRPSGTGHWRLQKVEVTFAQ